MVKITTPITNKPQLYSDIHNDLMKNPITDDLALRVNEEAVKQSIKNIVLTNKMERPFQPEFGCDIRKMLFDNITPDKVVVIKDIIKEAIENHEPRANLIGVDVKSNVNDNMVSITIVFNAINIEKPVTLDLLIERVR